uniref:Reverse transcriptase n=1 Tax=Panagrolaimus sp. ES5 TaxID=591445 RepID=A0AC34FNR6_9BILA
MSELYNFKAYHESSNRAMSVKQLIHELSTIDENPGGVSHPQVLELAQKVVAEGLFGFLRGGLLDLTQGWIFCTCLITTLQLLARYLLPLVIQEFFGGINVFAAAGFARRRVENWRAHRQRNIEIRQLTEEFIRNQQRQQQAQAAAALLPPENPPAIEQAPAAPEARPAVRPRPIQALWPALPQEDDYADINVVSTGPHQQSRIRFMTSSTESLPDLLASDVDEPETFDDTLQTWFFPCYFEEIFAPDFPGFRALSRKHHVTVFIAAVEKYWVNVQIAFYDEEAAQRCVKEFRHPEEYKSPGSTKLSLAQLDKLINPIREKEENLLEALDLAADYRPKTSPFAERMAKQKQAQDVLQQELFNLGCDSWIYVDDIIMRPVKGAEDAYAANAEQINQLLEAFDPFSERSVENPAASAEIHTVSVEQPQPKLRFRFADPLADKVIDDSADIMVLEQAATPTKHRILQSYLLELDDEEELVVPRKIARIEATVPAQSAQSATPSGFRLCHDALPPDKKEHASYTPADGPENFVVELPRTTTKPTYERLKSNLYLLGCSVMAYLDLLHVSPALGQETRYMANLEVIRDLLLVAQGMKEPGTDDPPASAGPPIFTAEMMALGSSKAHVYGTVHDLDFICLMDTGAALSLVTQNLVDKLGLRVSAAPPINLMGIGQSLFRTSGVVEVLVDIGGGLVPVIAQVYSPARQPSYELLIGCDTMCQLPPVTYNFQQKVITFGLYEADIFQVSRAEEVKEVVFPPTDVEVASQQLLYDLLEGFRDVISTGELDLGTCTEVAPPVVLTGPLPKPVKMYKTADVDRAAVKQFVEDGLKAGIIRPSVNAAVTSNVVVVSKENGKKRVCVDLRPLNSVVQMDPYPLADMSEIIREAAGAAWFSCLDLASGFLQIPLDPDSIPLFAFMCPEGVFEFLFQPFGYKNAPGIFQRLMKKLLADLPFARAYLDDILIFTRLDSLSLHLQHIRAVLERLRLFQLKIRAGKCQIAKRSVCYVGHVLDKNGYAPSEKHVEAFKKLSPPANVKELRSFLGMVNFFHKFVDSFAQVAGPLNSLLRKGVPFDWQQQQQHAFEQLIDILTSPPVLQAPRADWPFLIYSDASSRGIGAAILQQGEDGLAHVVMYVSRGLLPAECNYAIGELELLALVFTLRHQRALLLGRKIKWFTDNKPLSCLSQKLAKSPRMQRWLLEIQCFEIEFAHVPSIDNPVADGLSRFATEINAVDTLPDQSYAELLHAALAEDEQLQEVMVHMQQNWSTFEAEDKSLKAYAQTRGNLRIRKGLLYFKNRIIVPLSLRTLVLEILHRSHLGADRMIRLAKLYVWWPNSAVDMREYVAICGACKGQAKAGPKKPVVNWPQATQAWQRMHIDYAGPFEGSFWLILVDAHSKFVFVERMQTITAAATIIKLDKIFGYFGFPQLMISDNGAQLVSAEFEDYLHQNGVRHIKAPAYHPESNGLAERMVQTFKTAMKKIRSHDPAISMSAALRLFLRDYRNCPHSTTAVSPAMVVFGRLQVHPLDFFRRGEGKTAERQAREAPAVAATVPQPARFEVLQPVWRRILNPGEIKAKGRKTEPAVIETLVGNKMYKVRDADTGALHTLHEDDLTPRIVSTRLAALIESRRQLPAVELALLTVASAVHNASAPESSASEIFVKADAHAGSPAPSDVPGPSTLLADLWYPAPSSREDNSGDNKTGSCGGVTL